MVNPWIMVPLYIYPSAVSWKPLYTAIESNSGVTFRVIINPSSGPGGGVGSYPDKNYIAGISKLNKYKNTELLGYVDTAYAERRYTDAVADVDTYAAWSKYTAADIHVDGIFFDDNPNTDSQTPLSYLTNITTYTRKKLSSKAHIALNPGTYVSDKWYKIADSIVAFEDQYSDFTDSSTNTVKASQKAKSVFIVHSFKGTASQQQTLVNKIHKTGGIAASFVTSYANYDAMSRYFASYVNNVASLGVTGNGNSVTKLTSASKRAELEFNENVSGKDNKKPSHSSKSAPHTSSHSSNSATPKPSHSSKSTTHKPSHSSKSTTHTSSHHSASATHKPSHSSKSTTHTSSHHSASATRKPSHLLDSTKKSGPTVKGTGSLKSTPTGKSRSSVSKPTLKPTAKPTKTSTHSTHTSAPTSSAPPQRIHARFWVF